MSSDVIFVGYYTKNTPYQQEFVGLEYYLKNFGLDYDYMAVENRGSWQKNTQMKAEVIAGFIHKYSGRRLCYLDVDSVILQPPVKLFQCNADIGAVLFGGIELLSGMLLIQANSRTAALVDWWKRLNAEYPYTLPDGREAWDQRTLWIAIQQHIGMGLIFDDFDPAYNYIADLSSQKYPGIHPVILATRGASRFRAQIDGIG